MKMPIPPKLICRFYVSTIKIEIMFFTEIEKSLLNSYGTTKDHE
jgi:hypothetical protein